MVNIIGNTWGICANGTEGMGCGEQETFRNCADVSINSVVGSYPPGAIAVPRRVLYQVKWRNKLTLY